MTTDGVPLGLLDQRVFVRTLRSARRRRLANVTPIEQKESYRWLTSRQNTHAITGDTQVVTVCDREADMYELFALSDHLRSPVLVRANVDRAVNRTSRYAEHGVLHLWDFMQQRPAVGTKTIEIPERKATAHATARTARTAVLTIKYRDRLLMSRAIHAVDTRESGKVACWFTVASAAPVSRRQPVA